MKTKYRTYVVAREFFQGLLLTYMIFTVIETISEGMVSNYFNLNYLLLSILIFGVTMVMVEEKGFEYRLKFWSKE